jgi:hypothetical protein
MAASFIATMAGRTLSGTMNARVAAGTPPALKTGEALLSERRFQRHEPAAAGNGRRGSSASELLVV